MNINLTNIQGGILAGGLSRRMGNIEKSLAPLGNITLLNRVATRLECQVSSLIINANGDSKRFSPINHPVVADNFEGFCGPLSGIHALLDFAACHVPDVTHVATIAADTPFFPNNFVEKCLEELNKADRPEITIALASSNQNRHPTCGLWPITLRKPLAEFLKSGKTRKIMAFVQLHSYIFIDFLFYENGEEKLDPFFNINTLEDMERARALLLKPFRF